MFRHRSPPPEGYEGHVERMAVEMGIDLDASIAAGSVSTSAIERLMGHCAACASHRTCSSFMARQHGLIEAPPDYCVDRKLIVFLHELLPKPEPEDAAADAAIAAILRK